MRFLFLISVIIPVISFAQNANTDISKIINQERLQIEKIETEGLKNCLLISSEFADEILIKPEFQNQLAELTIIKAYYVYTLYKLSPAFNQKELDRKRFTTLNNYYPSLVQDRLFNWELLEQTGCTNFDEGDDYFHGFILIYRPFKDELFALDEFNRLSSFFNDPESGFKTISEDPIADQLGSKSSDNTSNKSNTSEKANYQDSEYELYQYFKLNLQNNEIGLRRYDKWVDVSFKVNETGNIEDITFNAEYPDYIESTVQTLLDEMPDWNPATENSEKVQSTVNLSIRVSYSATVKGMYKIDGNKPTFSDQADNPVFNTDEPKKEIPGGGFPDPNSSSTYLALEDYLPQKDKMSLVMDVTGSMAPYIAALTRWVLAHNSDHPFTSFTFFNDGDKKSDNKKKIGSVGGVYYSAADENIRAAIKNAMVNGNGGDRPENDVEAMLVAQEKDNATGEIFLLGDNWSEVRDMKLLDKIDKKVHVLICGDNNIPRPDYIKIAYDTGGDLIYNRKVYDLEDVSERETLKLDKYHYKYDGENFKRVK